MSEVKQVGKRIREVLLSDGTGTQINIDAIVDRLRVARKELGLTQKDLAKTLGCNRSWVANLEQGRGTPTLDYVAVMAIATGMSTDYFLFGDQVPQVRGQSVTGEELEILMKFRALEPRIQKDLLKRSDFINVLNDNYVSFRNDIKRYGQRDPMTTLTVNIDYFEISKSVIKDKAIELLESNRYTSTANKLKDSLNENMDWKEFIGKITKYVFLHS